MPDERSREMAFDRCWNAVFGRRHQDLPPDSELDADLPEAVQLLQSLAGKAPPDSARDRVDQGILPLLQPQLSLNGEHAMSDSLFLHRISPVRPFPHSGRRDRSRPGWLSGRWLTAQAALAALLLLMIGGLYLFVLGPGNGPQDSRSIPAVVASPAPESTVVADPTLETVANATVNVGASSVGLVPDWNRLDFSLVTIAPGEILSSPEASQDCCDGLAVVSVLEGTLSLEMGEPISAGFRGTPNTSADGSSVTLTEGDMAVFGIGRGYTATNAGAAPVRMLSATAYAHGSAPPALENAAGGVTAQTATDLSPDLPNDQLVHFMFERAHIESGQSLPVEVTENDALILLADGGPLTLAAEGRPGKEAVAPVTVNGSTTGDGLQARTYTLHNPGAGSTDIYLLRMGPDFGPPQPEQSGGLSTLFSGITGPPPSNANAAEAWNDLSLAYGTLDAGEEFQTRFDDQCCAGQVTQTVLKGQLATTSSEPFSIHRAADDWNHFEDVGPGESRTLESGDTAMFTATSAVTFANSGAQQAHFLLAGVADVPAGQALFPAVGSQDAGAEVQAFQPLYSASVDDVGLPSSGPVNVEVEELVLGPGDTFAFERDDEFRLALMVEGRELRFADQKIFNVTASVPAGTSLTPDHRSIVINDLPPEFDTLDNPFGDPATVYLLTVSALEP